MPECSCTHENPCEFEGCQEKDALVRILYGKVDELEKALKESA